MKRVVDLRSDTVTLQPQGMLEAMLAARVGDEYYGDDPSVNELQDLTAELLGKERALFLASGTMANLAAVLAHTGRGEALIVDALSHVYRAECANFAAVGGLFANPLEISVDGMDPGAIEEVAAAPARTRPKATLLVVENTHNYLGGTCVPLRRLREYRQVADTHGLKIHVDGARFFNACVALGASPAELAADTDSLSFCLSKGLAAPFGSLLAGSAKFIARARYFKQLLGGGLRQAGYLAAAGTWALKHMVARLAEDHDNAKALARGLTELGCELNHAAVQTNIVYFEPPRGGILANELVGELIASGQVKLNPASKNRIRLVTHYGLGTSDIQHFLSLASQAIGQGPK